MMCSGLHLRSRQFQVMFLKSTKQNVMIRRAHSCFSTSNGIHRAPSYKLSRVLSCKLTFSELEAYRGGALTGHVVVVLAAPKNPEILLCTDNGDSVG